MVVLVEPMAPNQERVLTGGATSASSSGLSSVRATASGADAGSKPDELGAPLPLDGEG